MHKPTRKKRLESTLTGAIAFCLVTVTMPGIASADAKKWVNEFQPSSLSKSEQMKELEWFAKAAEPYKGMELKVVSETIPTHEYESRTLAKAFYEITGIKVTHDLIGVIIHSHGG